MEQQSMKEILAQYGIEIPGLEKVKINLPDRSFYDFYRDFDTVKDLSESKEFKKIFSQFYEFTPDELDIVMETEDELETYGNPDHPNYDTDYQQREIIKCATNFYYFAHKYVKILHPIEGLLPCVCYKYQRRTIDCYEKHQFNILSKCRQGGLTTTAVIWALWKCMFRTHQQVILLSKTDREALSAGEISKRAIEHLPSWLKPVLDENNKHEKQFGETGSALKFYTPEAARGKAVTILLIDEAAFIPDMEQYWKDMYPVISTGGACVVISTVNGVGNWYEETYHKAEAKENDFNVIEIDYWEHPDYCDPKWVKKTYANLGKRGWDQEVMRSFMGSGESYIPTNILTELTSYTKDLQPIRFAFENWRESAERIIDWDRGALWIFKEPIDGHEYIIGVDTAEGVGRGGDSSCFQVIDVVNLEQVAEFYSNTIPPNVYAQIVFQIGVYYNTALVAVENNGVGGAVASTLQHDLAYDNLYYKAGKSSANKTGVQITATNRPVYLEALQHRIVNGTIRVYSRRLITEFRTFNYNTRTKRAEAQRGKHDDAIMALCIALWVRNDTMRDVPIGADIAEDFAKIFDSDTFKEIKQEILNESPEDWITLEAPEDPTIIPGLEESLAGLSLSFRRKNERLLKEFGWVLFFAITILQSTGIV